MKKSYILFAALFIGGTSFLGAQNTRWYNYAATKSFNSEKEGGNLSARMGYYLFPDTTIQITEANNLFKPQFHSVANVLDVTSVFFNNADLHPGNLKLEAGSTFTVDSMAVLIKYNRINNVTDTLYIEVAVDALSVVDFKKGSMSGSAPTAFNSDIQYNRVLYDGDTISDPAKKNTMYNPNNKKKIYTVLLNDAVFKDSLSNGLHLVKFATPGLPVATAGTQQVASAIKFIPGYSWNRTTGTDTLNLKNNVIMYSTEERGKNTFMDYKKGDFNISYFAGAKELYYTGPDYGANYCTVCYGKRYYDPSFSATFITSTTDAGWPLENHEWSYKVTCKTGCGTVQVGITEEADFTNGIKLGQNIPNPANGLSVINYELIGNSMVSLSVYDITGKRVLSLEEGKKAAGKHSVVIDTHQLQSGVYFYTLSSDAGASLTRKMIITE